MKNITIKSVADDLAFMKSVLDKATGQKKKFLDAQRTAVEKALTTYAPNISNSAASPLGLKKGRKATKPIKAIKASAGAAAVKGVPGKPATKDEHEYYYDLYDSTSKLVAGEKKKLNDEYFGHICPYCGVDTVRSIDHYLPRSDFPEFSISLQNLLMSCDFCNSTYKLTNWGNGATQRVINPLINKLPTQNFLIATCIYNNRAIIPSFSIDPTLPMSGLLMRHFVLMNLNERYKAKATLIETKEIKTKLESETTAQQKTSALSSFVSDKILVNPVNTWQYAFYVAVQPLIPQIVHGGL